MFPPKVDLTQQLLRPECNVGCTLYVYVKSVIRSKRVWLSYISTSIFQREERILDVDINASATTTDL